MKQLTWELIEARMALHRKQQQERDGLLTFREQELIADALNVMAESTEDDPQLQAEYRKLIKSWIWSAKML